MMMGTPNFKTRKADELLVEILASCSVVTSDLKNDISKTKANVLVLKTALECEDSKLLQALADPSSALVDKLIRLIETCNDDSVLEHILSCFSILLRRPKNKAFKRLLIRCNMTQTLMKTFVQTAFVSNFSVDIAKQLCDLMVESDLREARFALRIRLTGMLKLCCQLLAKLPNSSTLLPSLLAVMVHSCQDSSQNCLLIGKHADVVTFLLRTFSTYSKQPTDVLRHSLMLLYFITKTKKCNSKLMGCGFIGYLLSVVKDHFTRAIAGDVDAEFISLVAVACLRLLVKSKTGINLLVAEGCPQGFVDLLKLCNQSESFLPSHLSSSGQELVSGICDLCMRCLPLMLLPVERRDHSLKFALPVNFKSGGNTSEALLDRPEQLQGNDSDDDMVDRLVNHFARAKSSKSSGRRSVADHQEKPVFNRVFEFPVLEQLEIRYRHMLPELFESLKVSSEAGAVAAINGSLPEQNNNNVSIEKQLSVSGQRILFTNSQESTSKDGSGGRRPRNDLATTDLNKAIGAAANDTGDVRHQPRPRNPFGSVNLQNNVQSDHGSKRTARSRSLTGSTTAQQKPSQTKDNGLSTERKQMGKQNSRVMSPTAKKRCSTNNHSNNNNMLAEAATTATVSTINGGAEESSKKKQQVQRAVQSFKAAKLKLTYSPREYLEQAAKTISVVPFVQAAYPDLHCGYPNLPMQPLKVFPDALRQRVLEEVEKQNSTSVSNFYSAKVVFDLDAIVEKQPRPHDATWFETPPDIGVKNPEVDHLLFESRFECGNLRMVIQTGEREYDLLLSPDINQRSMHFQWFYFEVSNMEADVPYQFNIINLVKSSSQFSEGMQPLIFSVSEALQGRPGWARSGQMIAYYRNRYYLPVVGGKLQQRDFQPTFATLSFAVSFRHKYDRCFVVYHFPYTYSTLQCHLNQIEKLAKKRSMELFFDRRTLCTTLSGNVVPLLTITAATENTEEMTKRRYIFLSARIHPGESNSSWMMFGTLRFLVSNDKLAQELRERFIFKIIPMLNPDGVINGSHRCSLSGQDLNRQWANPNEKLHPSVFHTRCLLQYFCALGRRPWLFCDYHGHSRRKNVFLLGNDPKESWLETDRNAAATSSCSQEFAMLPRILSESMRGFSLDLSKFAIEKGKEGTSRVVAWRQLGITKAYTVESTFCGFDKGDYSGNHIGTKELIEMGEQFCKALIQLDAETSSVKQLRNGPCLINEDEENSDVEADGCENEIPKVD